MGFNSAFKGLRYAIFEALAALLLKMQVLWRMTTCWLVSGFRCYKGKLCVLLIFKGSSWRHSVAFERLEPHSQHTASYPRRSESCRISENICAVGIRLCVFLENNLMRQIITISTWPAHIFLCGDDRKWVIVTSRVELLRYVEHVRNGTCGSRVQLKRDGTRWRTGQEVKGKLANGVGSQYSSRYLGTWCIQHYHRWCAHLFCQ